MSIKNTSRYDKKEVARLIKIAAGPIDISDIAINVKNKGRGGYAGRAYPQVPCLSPHSTDGRFKYLVVVRIGKPEVFPRDNFIKAKGHCYGGKKSPYIEMADWKEALVSVTAHELMHIQQFRTKSPCSEVECERYALRRLEEYRYGKEVEE